LSAKEAAGSRSRGCWLGTKKATSSSVVAAKETTGLGGLLSWLLCLLPKKTAAAPNGGVGRPEETATSCRLSVIVLTEAWDRQLLTEE
jgi:hypothetical protein